MRKPSLATQILALNALLIGASFSLREAPAGEGADEAACNDANPCASGCNEPSTT